MLPVNYVQIDCADMLQRNWLYSKLHIQKTPRMSAEEKKLSLLLGIYVMNIFPHEMQVKIPSFFSN